MNFRIPAIAPAIAATLILATACTVPSEDAGESVQDAREEIVGGQATSSLPAVGNILRFGSPHCTGTVIGPRTIVTAAHCLQVNASSLTFAIGGNAFQPDAVVGVQSVTPHPNYNPNSLTNDIGYITLSQNAPVEPMGLLESMDSSFVGTELVFVGYGASNGFSQTGSGIKRFVNMPISQVGATQFAYQTPGKNTCNGDSGGPAFAQVNGTLLVAGVTSYGDANCVDFGVDTRVDTYKDFLPSAPPPPPTDPCGGLTFSGECNGNTVEWCENNTPQSSDCNSQAGKVCGFDASKNYFACIDAPPEDPCGGVTFEGQCDGNQLSYCANENVEVLQCNNCGFDTKQGFWNCLQ